MNNSVVFFEIPAADFERAVKFYETIFNSTLPVCKCEKEKMAFFTGKDRHIGAISSAPGFEPSPSGVLIHFDCRSIENTLRLVTVNGGRIIISKTKIEAESRGYFAVFADTEGNHIGLYEKE